jgi:hypothetical protein
MARKKKVSDRRVYDILGNVRNGDPEIDEWDSEALEEAVIRGFIKPSRFKTKHGVRVVAAFELTDDGKEFEDRIETE